jgi:hypothetical protein
LAPPAYSKPFIYYTDSTPNTEFDVPMGFVAVLRDFTAYASAAATICQILAQGSSEADTIAVAQLELAAIAAYGQWTGRVVLPYPGIFTFVAGGLSTGVQAYAGGYLLRA